MPTLGQDLRKLGRLKREAAELDKRAKDAKAVMEDHQRRCFERFQAEESEGHRTHGQLYTPVATTYANVQDREAFLEWAKVHDPELVKEVESSGDLNSLVRRCLDDGEALPPGVGLRVREYVSVRSSA